MGGHDRSQENKASHDFGGSSVHRPGREDHHRGQRNLNLNLKFQTEMVMKRKINVHAVCIKPRNMHVVSSDF